MPPSDTPTPAPLLSEAKLSPPRQRVGVIPRPQILAALDRFEGAELTLVSAPAGSGKTVAVASWLQERPQLSVGVDHDRARPTTDPVRLWTAIATAVDRLRPGIGRPALAILKTPRAQIEQVVDELLNGLSGYGGQAVIVLDDVHHIADDDALRSLGYAVEPLPRTTRLSRTTRADPAHLG